MPGANRRGPFTAVQNLERYRTQSASGAALLDRSGHRSDGPRRELGRQIRTVARFVVRVVAALAGVRAVDTWVVRLDPAWQFVAIAGIAVATALLGSAVLLTDQPHER